MISKRVRPFLKHKLRLYFDENFPMRILLELKNERKWRSKCHIISALDRGNRGRDDGFHYNFCKLNKLTLVTLDADFMDDNRYPILDMSGVILINAGSNNIEKIRLSLLIFLDFILAMPYPKIIIGDGKFQISPEGVNGRCRHAQTREIIRFDIENGDTILVVLKKLGF